MSRHCPFCFRVLTLLLLCTVAGFAADKTKKIVLIAGPITGHPKEAHEYEKNVIVLKHLLETSPDLQGRVRVEAHFKGWPRDPATLEDADTIFLTSDGTDREEKNHPLYVGDHLEVIERQMRRGCGLVLFHWSTFNPVRFQDRITDWVGGYFDYETGSAPNHWYSAIQTWQAESRPGTPGHPILRGVHPFSTQEEYYYRLRFRDADPRLKPIILTRPPRETNDFAVGWVVERADGGRGFGFTGGHFYANWWNADFRKLILNAIAWTANLEVPADGIGSEPFERFKVLVLTGHNHPAHDWRATTAALLLALEQDPRAIVHVSENIEDLAASPPPGNPARQGKPAAAGPAALGRADASGGGFAPAPHNVFDYDLLVLNYCNWEQPGLSYAARTNFERYLEGGGGLGIIHFANGAWHPSLPGTKPADAWPDFYQRICRRVWEHRAPNASGHDAYGPFRVEIAGARHPITDGLQPFDTVDELYFHQAGESPIEPLAVAASKTTNQREPMAWAYACGQGRVFQTVLGHSDESIRKAAALIRRGSVWAAGRNQLTFDPPPELTEGALFREGSPWAPKAGQVSSLATPGAPTAGGRLQAKGPGPEGNQNGRPPTRAGPAVAAGDELPLQEEKDWVDNRWSRTDVGPFLASSLRVPNGTITKALSIRVGDRGDAGVSFDTDNLNWRVAWTGGSLTLDAARFGLLNPPKIQGDVQFIAPPGAGWTGATGRFSGFHVNGKRIVLEYQLGDTTVRESPWYAEKNGRWFFTREFEIGAHAQPLSVTLLETRENGTIGRLRDPTGYTYGETNGNRALVIACSGSGRLEMGQNDRALRLAIEPGPGRVVVSAWSGETTQAPDASSSRLPAEGLTATGQTGAARWLPALETTGQIGPDSGPLAFDTLTVPYDNPWKALMFLSGVDFTSDGTAYVSSIHGDVWKVTGIDEKLSRLSWKRFATGLYQPLGLKVVRDRVYVLGRDRITRLLDENGDGEADFYEDYCNLIETSPEPHHYVTSLETDVAGNFYYVDPVGVHRVSPDGRTLATLATGFRNPNGMATSPDGRVVTVAPQQGQWTPSSSIIEIRPGGYYGYGGPEVTAGRPLGYDPVFCWIPHGVDNSGGSQVWVPEGKWDGLGSHLLHLSWGRCFMLLVLRDVVDGVPQGAVVGLPGRFLSGPMRGAFNPRDGHLYVVGSTGWQTSALKDGCFQRVRYTGKPLDVPVAWHVRNNGLDLTFAQPLEREAAEDVGSYGIEQWNYRYAAQYGSKDWSVSNPDREGHDPVEVTAAKLLADGRTVSLEMPGLKPVMQLQVQYNLNAKDGASIRGKLYGTINRVPSAPVADHR